ncbi:MAG TPA: beta-1,6-glucan synthase [Rhodocyclaceae bacterium]|nr:beta-1,6-glucan synthase [Rhodocyclaceae bacterium]
MSNPIPAVATPWRALIVVHLLALIGLFAWVLAETRPVAMHDLHLADGERLKCVSYAPYRLPGQTPFDPDLKIGIEQIRTDLAELARITECVRLYSVDQGLDQVPTVARELGLKVLLGAWISANPEHNRKELEHALALANANRDVVSLLIVGNEVLLRRERSMAQMEALIRHAQASTDVPVTYADVWEFWIENAELADAVDTVTVHILPFWENDPVGVDAALEHVVDTVREVRETFDKPVLIGETGWPSAGRQREASQPSRVGQARYIREFVHQAHQEGWAYNLIEAVDQPWKRRLEGTVGGFWGILDTELAPKFPLSGPVRERESAVPVALAALAGATLMLVLGTLRRPPRTTFARVGALLSMGLTLGTVSILQWEHAVLAYRDPFEWILLGALALIGLGIPVLVAVGPSGRFGSAADAWQRLRAHPAALTDTTTLLSLARGLVLFAAAVAALLLVMDPRYRDFPTLLYLVPALCLAPLQWLEPVRTGVEERVCAWVIAIGVIGRWISEPLNPQAVAWLAAGLLLAASFLHKTPCQHQQ